MSDRVILCLGGNVGNTREVFYNAIHLLEKEVGKIVNKSSVYRTKAWGIENQADFLNQVIMMVTKLNPQEVLEVCLNMEKKMGRARVKNDKWKERLIDIDILFFEDRVIVDPKLILPHPFIQDRNFVLFPLEEIIPDFIHPTHQKSIKELKKMCKDKLQVIKLLD